MILISGSSEREIVDLQQGDYEEMDQLAIARPHAKAAFRVLHAEDIGVGMARAIRAALSGRPGGVYLDLPAKLFPQTIDAEAGKKSLIKVVDPAPRQIPAPDAVQRALDLLRTAKRPLIILGKGAAYAQADADIRALVEKTGIPYLPMSMAKGLLPDTHEQSASAARSYVLPDADVVMLIGARLNWLLSHGKGKTWGGKSAQGLGRPEVRPDRHLAAGGGQQRPHRCAGRRRHRLVRRGHARRDRRNGGIWAKPPAEWLDAIRERKTRNVAKMAETLAKNPTPMNYHSALNVVRDIVKANPDAMLVNEGANALDFTRSIVDMYKPRKRLDVGTWGVMGIGMGYCVAAAVVSGEQVIAVEGDSAFGFSGMEVETICRYNLPVCVVILNNNGVYKGTEVESDRRTRSGADGVRQGRALREADGGLRRRGRAGRDAGRASHRDGGGDPLAQADADQRGHRREGGHGKRPHHEPQSRRDEEEGRDRRTQASALQRRFRKRRNCMRGT